MKGNDRKEFVDNMLVRVNEIPIDAIIGKFVSLEKRGRNLLGLCPFHNDHTIGSFVVSPHKRIFKCFACDAGGNGVSFVAKKLEVNYLQAAFMVAREFDLITLEEYETYANRRYSKGYIRELQKRGEAKKADYKKASLETCHRVYMTLKEVAGLKPSDRKTLSEDRELSDERIEADYFSFPRATKAIVEEVRKKASVTEAELVLVPGFYYDVKEKRVSFASYRGIGILIRNAHGKACGVQIRKHTVKAKEKRYVWFASTFARDDDTGKYKGGASSGSPKDILLPEGTAKKTICITEGRFKSETLVANGNPTISVQGVTSWRGIEKEITEIMSITGKVNVIYLFFDSDLMGNEAVSLQGRQMIKMLRNKFPGIKVKWALWRKENGKGIDDLAKNGKLNTVTFWDAEAIINAQEEASEKVLESFSTKPTSFRDIPREKAKEAAESLQTIMEDLLNLPE